jgi:hypothetical protein
MATSSSKTASSPLLPRRNTVHTINVKVTIGRAKDGSNLAVSPERVAEEMAISLRLLRDNYFKLTGQEMSWEFPFWARSLNG